MNIRKIVIVGGGTAGWMAAASLSNHLKHTPTEICLIESEEIGTVGVGEATLPALRSFNAEQGINEIDFIKNTQATFKLGIEFRNWYQQEHSFFHPFSEYGVHLNGLSFYHYWHRAKGLRQHHSIGDYSPATMLARYGKFGPPNPNPPSQLSRYGYAFHFDAALYGQYLRKIAVDRGVARKLDKINDVALRKSDGFIEAVITESGERLDGDLFIDCSGFRGLLIEQALGTGYEDWSHWLPCDRAVAVQSRTTGPPTPYTRATALDAGWQWRIPLQHRMGNGYVYCSHYLDDETALRTLQQNLEGSQISDPNFIKFVTGRRKKFWNKNCVALGLSAGFMEPLESTSIALIQTGLAKLTNFFPKNGFNRDETEQANKLSQAEWEETRDFLILHYKANQRTDTQFWKDCRQMKIPDSLDTKMRLYKSCGYMPRHDGDAFDDANWISMYAGFNILPEKYDIRTHAISDEQLVTALTSMRKALEQAVAQAPTHAEFIAKHCTAEPPDQSPFMNT